MKKHKCQPLSGTRGDVSGSQKSLGLRNHELKCPEFHLSGRGDLTVWTKAFTVSCSSNVEYFSLFLMNSHEPEKPLFTFTLLEEVRGHLD